MKKVSILALHLGYGGIEKSVAALANMLCKKYEVEIACTYKLFEKPVFPIDDSVKIVYLTDVKPNKVELKKDTDFAIGDFNILEPQNEEYTGDYDLIVVPGVAFDRNGNRIGRGKGYYDRFLCKHLDVKRIGICFDFQLVDEVPTEDNDIRMDEVVSL